MNLVPSRLSGLLVLPKPPPGICVDVRDGVPVETGHLPRRFCVFKGERVREKAFKRVNIKGRPKFKFPIKSGMCGKARRKYARMRAYFEYTSGYRVVVILRRSRLRVERRCGEERKE